MKRKQTPLSEETKEPRKPKVYRNLVTENPVTSPIPEEAKGILARTVTASVRISSADRSSGNPSSFSVFITPTIHRALGFYVSSVYMINSWFNISEYLANNGLIVKLDAGPDVPITIPDGAYSVAGISTLSTKIQTEINTALGLAGANECQVSYDVSLMRLTLLSGAVGSVTIVYGGTADAVVGIDQDVTSAAASVDPTAFPLPVYLVDYPFIAISSPQLRRPISIDSRPGGSGNCFMHLLNDAPKTAAIVYKNDFPTELSVIQYPAPQEFAFVQIDVKDPGTGLNIPLDFNWEIIIHFLVER